MKSKLLRLFPCLVAVAWGHPMGNFSISHYARFEAARRGTELRYVLDLAEIPTFELLRDWKLDAKAPHADLERRAKEQAREWARNLSITAEGRSVSPRLESVDLAISDGAGGLPVMRVTSHFLLPLAGGKIEYEDRNYPERAGWKEIVIAAGEGASLVKASHGDTDRSAALTKYPQDPAVAPPQDVRAALEWTVEAPAITENKPKPRPIIAPLPQPKASAAAPATSPAAPQPSGTVVRGDFLSSMLRQRDLGIGVILTCLLVAFVLGAEHALTPGHGKTIVAAYLIGTRGSMKHAVFLGGMVTFTHTFVVFLLGIGTLFLTQYVAADRITPVLAAISSLSIVALGGSLFYKRLMRLRGHGHGHDHHHRHGAFEHDHGDGHVHSHVVEGDVTMTSLIALGTSGGLVPCPSALVLLLSAFSLGRFALGLALLASFSLGLAVVLVAIGCTVLYAKHLLPEKNKLTTHPFFRLAPVLSAAFITCIGLVMTGVSMGWIQPMKLLM